MLGVGRDIENLKRQGVGNEGVKNNIETIILLGSILGLL